jgi:hypothetical protein
MPRPFLFIFILTFSSHSSVMGTFAACQVMSLLEPFAPNSSTARAAYDHAFRAPGNSAHGSLRVMLE